MDYKNRRINSYAWRFVGGVKGGQSGFAAFSDRFIQHLLDSLSDFIISYLYFMVPLRVLDVPGILMHQPGAAA